MYVPVYVPVNQQPAGYNSMPSSGQQQVAPTCALEPWNLNPNPDPQIDTLTLAPFPPPHGQSTRHLIWHPCPS